MCILFFPFHIDQREEIFSLVLFMRTYFEERGTSLLFFQLNILERMSLSYFYFCEVYYIMNGQFGYGYGTYMPSYMRTQGMGMPTMNPMAAPTMNPMGVSSPALGINWVLGLENAKSFYVEAGKSAILMDSERPVFYIKTVDPSGMGSIKAYEFSEISAEPKNMAPPQQVDLSQYVTREELETLLADLRPKTLI